MTQALVAEAAESEATADDVLVAAALEQPDNFGILYERYLPRIYRYMLSRTGSSDDAADLTQIVFTRAFDGLAGYRPNRAPFSAWLFRIGRNTATDPPPPSNPGVMVRPSRGADRGGCRRAGGNSAEAGKTRSPEDPAAANRSSQAGATGAALRRRPVVARDRSRDRKERSGGEKAAHKDNCELEGVLP